MTVDSFPLWEAELAEYEVHLNREACDEYAMYGKPTPDLEEACQAFDRFPPTPPQRTPQ